MHDNHVSLECLLTSKEGILFSIKFTRLLV